MKIVYFLSLLFLFSLKISAQQKPNQTDYPFPNVSRLNRLITKELKTRPATEQHDTRLEQRSGVERLDSVHLYNTPDGGNNFVLDTRRLYTYNNQGLLETVTYGFIQGSTSFIARLDSLFYDNNGRLIRREVHTWNGEWDESAAVLYTYDLNYTEWILQEWNGFELANLIRSEKITDNNGLALSDIFSLWDGSEWAPQNRSRHIYGNTAQLDSLLIDTYTGSNWEHTQRVIYSYDGQGRLIKILRQELIAGQWENDFLEDYTYEGNFQTIFNRDWLGILWENRARFTSLIEDGNTINTVSYVWDAGNWEKRDSAYYFFSEISGTGRPLQFDGTFTLYPNPVESTVNIQSHDVDLSDIKINVYNSTGAEVNVNYDLKATNVELKTNLIPSGYYYVQISQGNHVKTIPFFKR